MRLALIILLLLHGLIHAMGFVKAFGLAEVKELSLPISRPMGILWLLALTLFVLTAIFYGGQWRYWWVVGLLAVVLSQYLVITFWADAKYGSIANAILLLAVIAGFAAWNFEQKFNRDVRENLQRTQNLPEEVITEADLAPLPPPVQEYLRYVGVVGRPKVNNVRISFRGEMRSREQDWFSFTSEQYNFFDRPARLFFMKAKTKGLPAHGYHRYQGKEAAMQVKLFSLIPVVNLRSDTLFHAETVTVLNDRCLFAPATLIRKDLQWEAIDERRARVIFSNQGHTVSAVLHFNEEGQLINFFSDDRTDVSDMRQYTFSTPVRDYREFDGYRLASYGEAVWHYPEGAFAYGKFYLQELEYNVGK